MKGNPGVSLAVRRLQSGGIITNYHCPSKCGHCLYNSGPTRDKVFIEPERAAGLLARIKRLGCGAVHIGGGEPLLSRETVAQTLRAAGHAGVRVEYVETNSAWFQDSDSAVATLTALKDAGLTTLLVSISPFHNASIPFSRVRGVLDACDRTGVNVFPWIADFAADLSVLDEAQPHSLEAYTAHFGADYLAGVMRRYWVHPGGRALDLFRLVGPLSPASRILEETPAGCYRELADTSHFHVDLYGGYIPGLCAGLVIDFRDIGRALPTEKYPLIALLAGAGIQGLYAYAREVHGFEPTRPEYVGKCDLCNDIRRYLIHQAPGKYLELGPAGYYG